MPVFKVRFTKSYHNDEDPDDNLEVIGHSLVTAENEEDARTEALTYLTSTLHPKITWEDAKDGQDNNPDVLDDQGYVYTDFTFDIDDDNPHSVKRVSKKYKL
jgi:hypothetical protein